MALPGCRCADFVLLNKVDMLKEGDLEGLSQIAASLNPLAKVTSIAQQHSWGRPISPSLISSLAGPLTYCPAQLHLLS